MHKSVTMPKNVVGINALTIVNRHNFISLHILHNEVKLSCKKHILCSFSGDRRDRLLLQVSPVTENMLSAGTEPADMPRNSEMS